MDKTMNQRWTDMDTSEKRIMMAEKAVELQKLWVPQRFDLVYDVKDNRNIWRSRMIRVITSHVDNSCGDFHVDQYQELHTKKDFIWLPTPERIQPMIGAYWWGVWGDFHLWIQDVEMIGTTRLDLIEKFDSSEQLWMGFAMHRLFNKDWKDEDWIEEY